MTVGMLVVIIDNAAETEQMQRRKLSTRKEGKKQPVDSATRQRRVRLSTRRPSRFPCESKSVPATFTIRLVAGCPASVAIYSRVKSIRKVTTAKTRHRSRSSKSAGYRRRWSSGVPDGRRGLITWPAKHVFTDAWVTHARWRQIQPPSPYDSSITAVSASLTTPSITDCVARVDSAIPHRTTSTCWHEVVIARWQDLLSHHYYDLHLRRQLRIEIMNISILIVLYTVSDMTLNTCTWNTDMNKQKTL